MKKNEKKVAPGAGCAGGCGMRSVREIMAEQRGEAARCRIEAKRKAATNPESAAYCAPTLTRVDRDIDHLFDLTNALERVASEHEQAIARLERESLHGLRPTDDCLSALAFNAQRIVDALNAVAIRLPVAVGGVVPGADEGGKHDKAN